jgi:hypothetical protein
VAPVPSINGAPSESTEGDTISLTGSATDVSPIDSTSGFTFVWNVNKNGNPFASGSGSSLSFTPDDNGIYLVNLQATDKDGDTGTESKTITVTNMPPVVAITGPAPGSIYPVGPITFTGTYSDPGTADTHTAQWTLNSIITPIQSFNGGLVSTIYTFSTAGVYHLKLTVTDDDGGVGTATTIYSQDAYIVVYDPDGGFVTGGGWIDSPSGAYSVNPTMAGRANFGFVSKYKKGATYPTGATEFQFKVADFNFHSNSYEWLVVAGARAQYKGTGTVNGAGNYGFMLTAIDGEINGGGGNDKFRIKIWDKNNDDTIVYDNQLGAVDDANPSTGIQGGSIVIHNEK